MHFVGILPLSWRRIKQFRGSSIGHGGRSAFFIFRNSWKWPNGFFLEFGGIT